MTTEEFAAIDKLSVLARVAMEDFRSLPRKDFYPHHARFVSTTDNLNRFSPGNSELPDGHCAVCMAGAVLVPKTHHQPADTINRSKRRFRQPEDDCLQRRSKSRPGCQKPHPRHRKHAGERVSPGAYPPVSRQIPGLLSHHDKTLPRNPIRQFHRLDRR